MRTRKINPYAEAATLGAIAGMRSMTAPIVSGRLGVKVPRRGRFAAAQRYAPLLAAAELFADKLPFTPARTRPALLGGRVLAAVSSVNALQATRLRRSASRPVRLALAALSAVVASHLLFRARHLATERLRIPNFLTGLLEDALLLGVSRRLLTE